MKGGGDDKPSEDEASEALTPMMMRAPLLTSSEGKVNLKIATTELDAAGNPKTEYYAGGQIGTYATIEPSGNGFKLINPKIKITFPKKYVLSQPTFPQPESATSVKITQDVDNWYTTYSFDQLVGGKRIDIPLFFQMISNDRTKSTPDDFETEIKMELFEENGDLFEETTTTYTSKNYQNVADVFQRGNIYSYPKTVDDNGDILYPTTISIYDRGETHTAQGEGAPWIRLAIRVLSTGDDMKAAPLGRYLPKIVKIDAQLPAGAIPQGTLQSSGVYSGMYLQTYGNWKIPWTYDPDTNIATYSGAVYGSERHVPLVISYPDLPYTGADGQLSVHCIPFPFAKEALKPILLGLFSLGETVGLLLWLRT